MKQLALLLLFVLLFGCGNMSSDKEAFANDIAETLEQTISFNVEEAFPYATITKQKLQECVDLQIIKNKHPELAETIAPQLQQLMRNTLIFPKEQDSLVVKNLTPLGTLKRVDDTLQQQKFSYTLASKTLFKTDTLTANIISKHTQIDGTDVLLTKVIFNKQ